MPINCYAYRDFLSSSENLPFATSVNLDWRSTEPEPRPDPQLIAARSVRNILEPVARQASVLRVDAAAQDFAVVLRRKLPMRVQELEILTVNVALSVDESTLQNARQLEHLRHSMEIDDLARRQAKASADFVMGVMLTDPATARIYSMLALPPRVGGPTTPQEADALIEHAQLWNPQSHWVQTAKILQAFVSGLNDNGRREFLLILRTGIEARGTTDQLKELDEIISRITPPTEA